jgi:hypothetical protein
MKKLLLITAVFVAIVAPVHAGCYRKYIGCT